jgi:exo-beta-1,3-glucanase (GH17 family)
MRFKLFLCSLMSIFLLSVAQAKQLDTFYYGYNYDPSHSALYNKGVALHKVELMQQAVDNDFKQIKAEAVANNNQTGIIKTFFSSYKEEYGGTVDIAAIAQKYGLKLLLGVHQFKQNRQWTEGQVKEALEQVKKYPQTIVGLVVGNEDVNDRDNQNHPIMHFITKDVTDLKASLEKLGIELPMGVGTAQIGEHIRLLLENRYDNNEDAKAFIDSMDFLGVNIYVYGKGIQWDQVNQPNQAQHEQIGEFNNIRSILAQKNPEVTLIMGEEGWPSATDPGGSSRNTSLDALKGYYAWWKERTTGEAMVPRFPNVKNFSSFYFGFFDKTSGPHPSDSHFGLAYIGGEMKEVVGDSPKIGVTVRLRNKIAQHRNFVISACKGNTCWPIHGRVEDSRINNLWMDDATTFKFDRSIADRFTVNLASNYNLVCTIDPDQLVQGRRFLIIWSPQTRCGEE